MTVFRQYCVLVWLLCQWWMVTTSHVCPFNATTDFACQQIRLSSVHKCKCAANQVWHDPVCVTQTTRVPVVNFDPWQKELVPTELFNSSRIESLQCKDSELLTPLEEDSFHLLPSGELIQVYTGVIYPSDKYCVEHVLDLRRKKVRIGGFVCIKPPELPLCCDNGQFLDTKTFECIPNSSLVINPAIYSEPSVLRWKSLQGYKTGLPACYDTEVYRQFDIDTGKQVVLLYRSNGVFLHWKTAPYRSPFLVNPQEFCVVLEQKRGSFYHSAYICDEAQHTAPTVLRKTETQHHAARPIAFVLPVVFVMLGRL